MIYLATKYSHPSAEERQRNYEIACEAFHRFALEGHVVYSPIVHCHPTAVKYGLPTDAIYWKNFNEHIINLCTELWVLKMDGIEESKGVQAEISYARALQIPVKFIE